MDWATVLKPFQSNSISFGTVNQSDLLNIAKAIIKNESHFLDHDDARSSFYVVVATIASDQISTQICNPVTQLQFATLSEAGTIIIKFILEKLDKVADSARCFLLLALKCLCGVKGGLPVADQTILLSMLKSITPPEMLKSTKGTEKDSPKSELKRSRFDLSSAIMQQLVNPLDTTGSTSWAPLSEEPSDCSEYFFKLNRTFLYEINAMDKIINLCTSLPVLSKYKTKFDECVSQGRPLQLPLTAPEAYNVKYSLYQMVLDISVLSAALSLPIIEPLSSERITQLAQCALSALYCGITVSVYGGVLNTSSGSSGKSASNAGSSQPPPPASFNKEQLTSDGDPMEELSRQAVNKALDVFASVGALFKQSVRGFIYRNLCAMGVWMMVSGIQAAISAAGLVPSKSLATEDAKLKSPSRQGTTDPQPGSSGRMNFFKIQQNFGVLNNAIATQCLTLWTELIDDMKMESRSGNDIQNVVEPVGFDVLENYSSLQCVARILNSTSLSQLLTFLATVSYRKATSLRRANSKNLADDEAISYTDSTTYFNETIICSEDSETEEDDSDSYLGLWFKETLSPESKEEAVEKHNTDSRNENGTTVVAVKDEPHEYLELSAQIFSILDLCLSCNHKYLRAYMKNGLTEHQIVLLANILKDLDRDSVRSESESPNCVRWMAALEKLSGNLCRYLHNLICNEVISESLQSSLLLHLGVSPWTYDLNVWPLQVYPRTLSVLVQIILMKPLQEKEAACLSVWHRLINTLVEGVCLPKSDSDAEDLNVEHAQLLLYLFHSLNLMQKKSILLLTAGGVIRCAEICRTVTADKPITDHQVILLSRLLLLLEYLMKHLYNAPNTLLEQVRFNLFNIISLPAQKFQTDINKKAKMVTYCKKDLEERHKKWNAEANRCIRPRFYSLTVTENKLQQDFKLDGLAWNFILCTPDKLKYQLLVDSLIDILGVLDVCTMSTAFSTLSVAYYCFGLAWKLLLGLPPSTQHVEALMTEKVPEMHSLLWSIRCQYVSQEYLIENSLVKQGMYTEDAKSLWKKVSTHVSQLRFSLMQTIQGLGSFTKSFQYQTPKLSKVILVDTLVTRISLVLEQELKKKKSEAPSSAAAADTVENIRMKSQMPDLTMDGLFNDLLVNLLDAIELLKDSLFHQSLNALNERANSNLLQAILKIANAENQFCPELAVHLLHFLSGQDVDVNLWAVELKLFNDGVVPSNVQQLEEYHALQVVEAHLSEIVSSLHFSIHPYLAHPFKTALNAVNAVLEDKRVTLDEATIDRILQITIPLMFDVRTEFVFKIVSKTVELILDEDKQSEKYKLLCYKHVLRQSYKFVIDASELCNASLSVSCPDESVICDLIFKFWESMLDKPMGARALYDFFCVDNEGSLVALLFSFTNSSVSQCYSTKVLQFIEKLFTTAEKKSSVFSIDKLCQSLSELATVDSTKLKTWLSHILLGPVGGAQNSSANSSNVQTPTNVTTVVGSGPVAGKSSKTDAIELDIEFESEMDIDLECSAVGGTGIWQQHAIQSQRGAEAAATSGGAVSATTNRSDTSSAECLEKNGRLLQTLTKYLVSDQNISTPVSTAFFTALIQIGQSLLGPNQEALNFCDLLHVMVTLADGRQGSGHATLFASAVEWLEMAVPHVVDKAVVKANGRTVVAFENLTTLLKYLSDILQLMGSTGSRMSSPPPWEEDTLPDMDDLLDDDVGQDEDDSTIEDSDEDSLGNKLCTFFVTQKEFMNQHWYHCHTCKMVDGVGVCSICARVCHKNHDVSYAKYGNFFCDCGAKEDGSCQALTRRLTHGSANCNYPKSAGSAMHQDGTVSSTRDAGGRGPNSPTLGQSASGKSFTAAAPILYMVKTIDSSKGQVADVDRWKRVLKFLLDFIETLLPAIKTNCARYSTVGCHKRAKQAMERLQAPEKTFYFNVEVMTPAMGTQESAFENVRISYSGEQGQTIRQLISTNLVRRVTLCCLSSPLGKRQHLAVSLEKGKVLIFQLSILLRQDISKKKLTLNRIASVPINCTVLSLAANPANEDFLVVCGLKECHVLTLAANGSMKDHIVLMPQLETGNFIKRAIWLPGSQTHLALVTADFVKIYDLAKDSYSPEYYFLLPNGKIRDCAFMKEEETYYMFLMASSGYIYVQPLTSQSLAQHGPFYVVETLQLDHLQIKQVNGQLGGGGASIYYSSVLQILFFSFSQGKSFMAPLTSVAEGVKCVIHLQVGTSTKSSSKGPPQPLCQWSEIPGHPGIVCSMMQTSNNPVIFMIKPDAVYVQEIKATSAKAKIMDMVAIKHAVYGVDKTTLILLCEDGNLRIHTANPENTGFWMSSEIQPVENLPVSMLSKSMRRRKALKEGAGNAPNSGSGGNATDGGAGAVGAGNPTFPIDFFEHCVIMNDVEFGGNHMLQVYNSQLLKHRLTTTGLYVASTRMNGFTMDVMNNDPQMVITGFRILIGSQSVQRAPMIVSVHGRSISTMTTRPRWFDFPLTWNESLHSDKKLSITFGPSQDQDDVCMLDSIKVYGKTKEIFGWPKEQEDLGNGAGSSGNTMQANSAGSGNNKQVNSLCSETGSMQSLSALDKMISTMLEVLDSGITYIGGVQVDEAIKRKAIEVSTALLIQPTPVCVQNNVKCILASLFGNRQQYHHYKDLEILREANAELQELCATENIKEVDPEAYYRLVTMIRGIAVTRPHSLAKICSENGYDVIPMLLDMMRRLHQVTPAMEEPVPIVKRGLCHLESIIHCLVDIIYAFAYSQPDQIDAMTEHLANLLLEKSSLISHSTKQALIKLLQPITKRKKATSSANAVAVVPVATAPAQSVSSAEAAAAVAAAAEGANENLFSQIMQELEPMVNQDDVEDALGIAHEVDDEEFLEIAIAMSLQDQENAENPGAEEMVQSLRGRALQTLQALGDDGIQAGPSHQVSDPVPSTTGSDDEASSATTLRTPPPADQVGSESAGSGVDSTTGDADSTADGNQEPGSNAEGAESANVANEQELSQKICIMRCTILEKMIDKLDKLDNVGGVQAIPFMQVIHILTMDLDGSSELGQRVMYKLLAVFIKKLDMVSSTPASEMRNQTAKTEVQWLILRMFSVFMGKVKSSSSKSSSSAAADQAPGSSKQASSSSTATNENVIFFATSTANALMKNGAIPYCLLILESFLPYWTNITAEEDTAGASAAKAANNLLEASQYGPVPDMMPFYTLQKGSGDPYESYSALITEIAMKLLYQILKLSSGQPSNYDWNQSICEYMTYVLCEYMMYWQTQSLRRQVRKLLLYICGSKEKYRRMRDIHSLNTHIKAVKKSSDPNAVQPNGMISSTVLSYDALVELTEHLKACQEIATIRTGNWQLFCFIHSDILSSLLKISCQQLDDGISSTILHLLQSAICNLSNGKPIAAVDMNVILRERKDREKSEESVATPTEHKFDPLLCAVLVTQVFSQISGPILTKFIRNFLLETNSSNLRWQAHSLIYAFYENSAEKNKEQLLEHLWSLWPLLSMYGRRTAQFVDLLGYLTLNTPKNNAKLLYYTQQAVNVLRQQNELLSSHPNAKIYASLAQVLQLDGYYLESELCLVCNNPEVPMNNIKLSSIKIDSKFTTTSTLVKLVCSHTISRINLRIADLKRAKMVKTINIYYNNRTVQAIVELKNRPTMWHKARRVNLSSGQTEVKVEFPIPITACNLMIEYADFYESQSGSSENLQCPRCNAAVPANPGVCGNCGENVFQCHKCRAINYDEKDPFLCHSCGFCKYAKFDYTIFGRMCCAVDPIESAEDRTKTVQLIYALLMKADLLYRQLQINREDLELLLQKNIDDPVELVDLFGLTNATQVHKVIQVVSQKYCVESKASFEDLSKIIQKVQASRRELVAYDKSQMERQPIVASSDAVDANGKQLQQQQQQQPEATTQNVTLNRCFGCALASTEQCLTLLRALASNPVCQAGLCKEGLVDELAHNNLRRGTPQIQSEVRSLLCLLTKDQLEATNALCALIRKRVALALCGSVPVANLDVAVHHEMSLLMALIANEDNHWEEKLKTVFELFTLACQDPRGPATVVIQPCLKIVESLLVPPAPISEKNQDLKVDQMTTVGPADTVTVSHELWLKNNPQHSYSAWKRRRPPNLAAARNGSVNTTPASSAPNSPNAQNVDQRFGSFLEQIKSRCKAEYLTEKFGRRWRQKVLSKNVPMPKLELQPSWLQKIFFNPNSGLVRKMPYNVVDALSSSFTVKRELMNLFTSFLKYVGDAGEASAEFMTIYLSIAEKSPWRQYLVLKGVLITVADLITQEIEKIHRLEDTTVSSDLVQGYALHRLVDLLQMFLENEQVLQANKGRLLGPVLQGYLSLRKLVIQRTRLIDEAQEKLLEMLEVMTTGTSEETRDFMAVLIETVDKTPMNDIKTPVFIFERLCSIIHPEENDVEEFFLTLEKDQQQEDFLQGRMLGNPYPSSAPGLGPLMRDVKNKICTDCELVALLEDDNGMELLVNNKIISLDLPVKEIYKKVWLAEGGSRDSMRIVYRMRGLLGDATEEFIETLNNKSQEAVDNEKLYKMANVLAECGGLRVMLERITSLQNVSACRPLLQVLLKLFLLSVKVRRCQTVLCQPDLEAINCLLKVLQMCLRGEHDGQAMFTEQLMAHSICDLLEIMEVILSRAASETLDSFLQFSLTFGGPEYVQALINCTTAPNIQNNALVLRHLIRVLAALVYGNDIKMALLCEHFKSAMNFVKFDAEHTPEDEFKMELFCILTNQIEHNAIGGTLKDYIMSLGMVDRALEYISTYAPQVKTTLQRTDSDELKEFISRPSLKYILRFLAGLCTKHEATQVAVSKDIIPIIHQLEQVSAAETVHVGCLAENLLEALCTDPGTADRVQQVREFTRAEKKRLAMATREKQLDALGMRTNEKGQVTAKGSILQKIEKLRDETGLTCFICREGYACQPSKVLGIYTFTKRVHVEPYEAKRKTYGYTTVTHFNVVHIECHVAALRTARGRDDWESASLQNANTRCNGLLPLWGPDVSESAFSSCMSRHNLYMQESTQRCEISFNNAIHDLKLLLNRFAFEKSFHEDAGGGGPQSNMHLVPYSLFYALYILLSSRSFSREEKALVAYLTTAPSQKWLECAYEVEGPLYQITLSLALHTPAMWQKYRIEHLKRVLALAHVRQVSPNGPPKELGSADRTEKDYLVYKGYLMFWAMIDLIYKKYIKTVTTPKEEDWPISLFDYLRRNDEALQKASEAVLPIFSEEYQPCASFAEFCDVAELLTDIEDPTAFLNDLLQALGTSSTEGEGASSSAAQ